MTPPLITGTGPSELHAMIDLEDQARLHLPIGRRPSLRVLTTAGFGDSWTIVAELRPDTVGER